MRRTRKGNKTVKVSIRGRSMAHKPLGEMKEKEEMNGSGLLNEDETEVQMTNMDEREVESQLREEEMVLDQMRRPRRAKEEKGTSSSHGLIEPIDTRPIGTTGTFPLPIRRTRFGNITYNIRKRPLKTSRVKFLNRRFLCRYGKPSSSISTSTSTSYMPSEAVKLRMRKPYTNQGNSSPSSTSLRLPPTTKGLGEGPSTSMQMRSSSLIHTKKGSCGRTADISRSSLSKSDPINTAMSSNLTRSSGRNSPKYPRLFSMAHSTPTTVREGTLAGGELVVAPKSVDDSTPVSLTQTAGIATYATSAQENTEGQHARKSMRRREERVNEWKSVVREPRYLRGFVWGEDARTPSVTSTSRLRPGLSSC